MMFLLAVGGSAIAAAPDLNQSPDIRIPFLPRPVSSAGRAMLAFEIHLTNLTDTIIDLRSVHAVGPDGMQVGDEISGDRLIAGIGRDQRPQGSDPTAIAPGEHIVIYVEIDTAIGTMPDISTVEVGLVRTNGHHFTVKTAPEHREQGEVPVLAPPLRGGAWVAVHHPSWERGHRRMMYTIGGHERIPGRYAIDWVGVADEGRITTGNPDRPQNAIGYGAPVFAGAHAMVAAVRDDMPEAASIAHNPPHRLGEGSGNFVALRLGKDRFAFYEHLQPGSIMVRAGDRVRAGQIIGKLGFSGDTTGPHLHLHVADCASTIACEGIPFTVSGMVEIGRYDPLSALGTSRWQDDRRRGKLRPEWPGYNVVVRFDP